MKSSVLRETLAYLREVRSQYGNARARVTQRLDKVIAALKALDAEGLSEPEMATCILEELGMLFSELPEIKAIIESLQE